MALRLKHLSDSQIRDLAAEYTYSGNTLDAVAKKYGSCMGTLSNILYYGVAQDIIDDTTTNNMITKIVSNSQSIHQAANRWNRAKAERKQNRIQRIDEEIQALEAKLQEAKFKFDSFDDVESSDCPYTKDDISRVVDSLSEDIQRLKHEKKNIK